MVAFAKGLAERGLEVATFNFLYMEQKRRVPDPAPMLERCFRAAVEAIRSRAEARAAAGTSESAPAARLNQEMPRGASASGDGREPVRDAEPPNRRVRGWGPASPAKSTPRAPRTALIIGGKSMGGRIATHIAAAGDDTAAAVDGVVLLGYPLHPPGKPQQLRAAHLPQVRVPMLFVQGSRDSFGTPEELAPILQPIPGASLFVVDGGDHSLTVKRAGGPSREQVYAMVQDEIARWVTEELIH
jgi:predicted alpha/beta-hydrolase family hydrolase